VDREAGATCLRISHKANGLSARRGRFCFSGQAGRWPEPAYRWSRKQGASAGFCNWR
jgi:hypothetical protein